MQQNLVRIAIWLIAAIALPRVSSAAPANDNFSDRTALSGILPISAQGSTVQATSENNEPTHVYGYLNKTIWWSWTAAQDGVVEFDLDGTYSTSALNVYESAPETKPNDVEIVIDNHDAAAVTIVGDWTTSAAEPGYFGSDYLHDGNAGQGSKSVSFKPGFTGQGDYDVYIRWTASANRATAVPVDIKHVAGIVSYSINERSHGGEWVKLNTSGPLTLDETAEVKISNAGVTDGYVIADAVRFVRAPAPSLVTLRELAAINGYGSAAVSLPVASGHSYQIAVATYANESSVSLRIRSTTKATILSPRFATALINKPFEYQITANNTPTYFYTYSLPPGMYCDSATGTISGTPTQEGSYRVLLQASGLYDSAESYLLLQVEALQPRITSPSAASGKQGDPFAFQVMATKSPTSYSASGLPGGLSIDESSGLISGTPLSSGSYNITISAFNTDGQGVRSVSLVIASGAPVVTAATRAINDGDQFSYQIEATGLPTSYGAIVPDGLTIDAATGLISGKPTSAGRYEITVGATNRFGEGSSVLTLKVYHAASDNFATRTPVTGKTFTIFATNEGATSEPREPLHAGIAGGASVWFTWKAPETGTYRVSMDATFSYLLGIYEGSRLQTLHSVIPIPSADVGEPSTLVFSAVSGRSYQFAIDGVGGETGDFTLLMESLGKNASQLLTVSLNGHGSLTDGFIGTSFRRLGAEYTVVATPAPGSVFTGWSGSVASSNPRLTFIMQEDTYLTAEFIDNPATLAKGAYLGLLSSGEDEVSAGRMTIDVSATGAFTAQFSLGGRSYHLKGILNPDGSFNGTLERRNEWPLTISFQVDLTDANLPMTGEISDDLISATFTANRATLDVKTNPAQQVGQYTWLITGLSGGIAGNGYGTMKVDKAGGVRWTGLLPDGTTASAGGKIADNGTWILYASLNKGRGQLSGEVTFAFDGSADASGSLTWRRAVRPGEDASEAFVTDLYLTASLYAVPPNGTRAISFGTGDNSGQVVLDSNATFGAYLDENVVLTPDNRLVAADDATFRMSIAPASGLFSGRMFNAATGRIMSFGGAVLQRTATGGGLMKVGHQPIPVTLTY